MLDWSLDYLRQPDGPTSGEQWVYTPEQVRLLLWWYAVDERGRFVYRRGVLRRMKGWGKDPFAASLAAVEFLGPCRFAGWGADGQPVAAPHPQPWIQTAAVSREQTRNTMTLFPGLLSRAAIEDYGVEIGKEVLHSSHGGRIEAITSSPRAIEGGRPTLVIANETQHWVTSNSGHDMAAAIRRNLAKSRDGSARGIEITNAHQPGEDSVAERSYDAWCAITGGKTRSAGLFYDSLEAPSQTELADEESLRAGLIAARGDSTWVDIDRLVGDIYDPGTPASVSRRYYLNQITAAKDAWCDPVQWDACADPQRSLTAGDELALFFDGSKSEDATGLVACRISDGHLATLGCWQRPAHVADWKVDRDEVDDLVSHVAQRYAVRAFFADPGSGQDESGVRYWDALIDQWASRYSASLAVHASTRGNDKHAVVWDMSSARHQEAFTVAAERFLADVEDRALTHDGDPRLRAHVGNARRRPNRWGISFGKEHRQSHRKVDLAVCAVGARMARRETQSAEPVRQRSGKVYCF